MSQIPLATPLAGIKVLEFSHTVMGPTAGLVFAELGADVIKVEPAPKGDHTRGLGGFGAGFFAAFNRNKRSLAMDLKREDGQAVIHRLIPTADLVLENFGPGTQAPGKSALLSGGADHRRGIVSDLGRAAG
jgi:crotonobetainyl-CoA:carnitine CoA-transferase CaiB-like acyl-CoA transferase